MYSKRQVSNCPLVVQPNPIRHLCRDLKMTVPRCFPFSLFEFERICHEELDKMPKSRCKKVVETYPKHFEAVISGNDFITQYWRLCFKIMVKLKMFFFLVLLEVKLYWIFIALKLYHILWNGPCEIQLQSRNQFQKPDLNPSPLKIRKKRKNLQRRMTSPN